MNKYKYGISIYIGNSIILISGDIKEVFIKILVVDDDKTFLLLAKQTLDSQGYEIETTTSAFKALINLLENINTYDLLITDINMPLMDGGTLQEKVKITNHQIKVIGVSGYNIDKKKKDSFDYFLAKPFKLNDFRTTVKEALSNPVSHI